jgi:molecular chaperone GrpE (heat shock protein)
VIVEELLAGYMLHDRLLRAAKVKVRAAPSSSADGQ